MISVADAQIRLLQHVIDVAPRAPDVVDIRHAVGRILAEDIIALRSHPPFAASAMDGYAVQWDDIQTLPLKLAIIGESHAGRRFSGRVEKNQAVRIFTGAPLPDGADTIVVQEDAERFDTDILIKDRPAHKAGHVRPQGLDIKKGNCVARAGSMIDIRVSALIASTGHTKIRVTKQPSIDLILCGDELKLPGEALGPDDIVSTNGMLLENILAHAGARITGADRLVPDDLDQLTKIISASTADIIITCGGASVGERDFIQAALIAAGAKIDFWKIAMRPGKPLMVARLGPKIIIGLPGNPVSAFVCAILFAQPLVRIWQDCEKPMPEFEDATWQADMPKNGPRMDFIRVTLRDGKAEPLTPQDSSMLSILAQADALAVRAPNAPAAAAGSPVNILRLSQFLRT
jgi:molybdopterin molybdotransferase